MESSKNFTYMAFGLMSEVGEVADKVAKWRRKGIARIDHNYLVFNTSEIAEVDERKKELMAELGDCLWMIAGLAEVLGFSLEEVAEMNLDKLASRQQRGVIDGSGDNR